MKHTFQLLRTFVHIKINDIQQHGNIQAGYSWINGNLQKTMKVMKPVNAKHIKVTNANQTGIRILDRNFDLSRTGYRQHGIDKTKLISVSRSTKPFSQTPS